MPTTTGECRLRRGRLSQSEQAAVREALAISKARRREREIYRLTDKFREFNLSATDARELAETAADMLLAS